MPADVDDTILKDMFYLDASEVESYAGKMAMTMTSADNVLAVQAKSGQADAVQEALEQRLDLQAGDERETAALTNGEECKTSDRK